MVLKMFKMDSGLTLQNALATAGISSIFIDNVSVPSNGIVDYMKAKNGK